MSEAHAVFPDPEGEKHPDRKGIRTARDLINHAINDIEENATWDARDDGIYCLLCAPGGYRIRKGARPSIHMEQRNPDNHKRNLRWATVQWFKASNIPLPIWPDCYDDHHGALWCHICRGIVGAYDREDGERHDQRHRDMKRDPMRPDRLIPRTRGDRASTSRHRAHVLDEILRSREVGYDPAREAASARGQFAEPAPDPNRAPAVEGSFTATGGQSWRERLGYNYADNSVPGGSRPAKNNETGRWEEVTPERLAEWVEYGGQRWRAACALFDFCTTKGVRDPCIGEGCECSCHRDADAQEGSYEPPVPPIIPRGPSALGD